MIKQSRFQNGIDLLQILDPNAHSVTILIFVNVGSRYEHKAISGIAHYVEHTFFKGSEKYPNSKVLGMEIEKLGGSSNAFTGYEYTGYYIKVPKDNFVKAVEIISDLIKNPLFPNQEVEKERGVIVEEIRMYDDIPMRKVDQQFMSELFGGNPLGRDIAGSIETVSSMGRNEILDFVASNYTGENLDVVIAGNADQSDINKIEEFFQGISQGSKNEFEKFSSYERELKTSKIQKDLEQTHIVIGGFGKSRGDEMKYPIKLGNTILSSGFGSILFQSIREDLGLAYYIKSSHNFFHDCGYWSVNMGVDNTRIQQAVDKVVEKLKDFVDGEFDEDDIDRAKNYYLGNLVTELESTDEKAYWYGTQFLLENKIKSVGEIKSMIMDITKDEIIEAWVDVLSEKGFRVVSLSKEMDWSSDAVEGLI